VSDAEGTLLTRRQLLAAAAASPLALLSGARPARAADPPPNFLFILADDFGYADLSCYGRRDFTTPNIDRLGAEGMKFMQAYANSAVCTASRTAIITGRYQYRLAIGLEEPLGNRNIGLPASHPTFRPNQLADHYVPFNPPAPARGRGPGGAAPARGEP
jgi:hypothetical protein